MKVKEIVWLFFKKKKKTVAIWLAWTGQSQFQQSLNCTLGLLKINYMFEMTYKWFMLIINLFLWIDNFEIYWIIYNYIYMMFIIFKESAVTINLVLIFNTLFISAVWNLIKMQSVILSLTLKSILPS